MTENGGGNRVFLLRNVSCCHDNSSIQSKLDQQHWPVWDPALQISLLPAVSKCAAMTSMNKCRNKGIVYRNEEKEVNKKSTISLCCSHRHTAIRLFGQEAEATCLTSPFPFLLVNISSSPKTTLAELAACPFLTLSVFLNIDTLVRLRWIYATIAKKKNSESRPKSWQVDAPYKQVSVNDNGTGWPKSYSVWNLPVDSGFRLIWGVKVSLIKRY